MKLRLVWWRDKTFRQNKKAMISTIEELTPPAGEETGWKRPQLDIYAADEADSVAHDQPADGESGQTGPLDQALMKLLYELVVGVPALSGIQALRIWLYQSQECSVRLQLLMDGLPTKVSSVMEFPWTNRSPAGYGNINVR